MVPLSPGNDSHYFVRQQFVAWTDFIYLVILAIMMAKFGLLPADVTVCKGPVLFPRIDMEKELAELEEMLGQEE